MIHAILFAAALMQTPPPAAPASPAPPAPPPPVDCTDADHSAFAFWVGEWDVRPTGTDTVVARSVISSTAGGCAIEEDYHQTIGPGGAPATYHGVSFSTFDAAGGLWRQFYVDSGGSVTMFGGGLKDGAMVLDAPGLRPGVTQRMTIAPLPDGSVRQWGQTSTDGGATWTSGGYDFTYRRR